MDWRESRDAHVFEIEVPGVTKQDVKLQLHRAERVLEVTAQNVDETEDEKVTWHWRERGSRVSRRFRLPENANVEEIKASMRDGVLTVTVPKRKHKASKKVKIMDGDVGHKGVLGRLFCSRA